MPRSGRSRAWVPVLSALRQLASAIRHAVGVTVRPGELPPPPESSRPAAMPQEADSGPPSEWLDYLQGRDPVWLTGQPTPLGDHPAEDELQQPGAGTSRPPAAPAVEVQPPAGRARLLPAGRARLLPETSGPGPVADLEDGFPREANRRPAGQVATGATERPGPAGRLPRAPQLPLDRPFPTDSRPAPLGRAHSTPGGRGTHLLPTPTDDLQPEAHGTDQTERSRWYTRALPEDPDVTRLPPGSDQLPTATNPAAPSSVAATLAEQPPINAPGATARGADARYDQRPNSATLPEQRVLAMPLRNRAGAVTRADPPSGGAAHPTPLRWAPLPDTDLPETSDTADQRDANPIGSAQVSQIWQRLGNGPRGDRLVAAQRSR